MVHPQGSSQGSVSLDDDIVRFAKGRDLRPGVERVDLDLVDCRTDARFGSNQFLQLSIYISE